MSNQYKYKFSVIMPIYNVEKYLCEAVDSIVNQTIGFEESIQLILVNDGSTDSCGDICNDYKNRYPNNVIYIEKENRGVSHSRNTGIPYIQGKYVNFFDGDDKWELEAFEKVWDFFEEHSEEIDVVSCRSTYFEGKTGEHNLNNKFKAGDRVIDIRETPNFILLNVTTAFISAEAVSEQTFDERISVGEDSKYAIKAILRKEKFGVLGSANYYIRKRQAESSLTQNYNIGRYRETIDYYYKHMLDYSEETYGQLLPHIQHAVINGLKYRVLESQKEFMTSEQWREYTDKVIAMIKRLDDEVIATTNNISIASKLYLISLKHDIDASREVYIDNDRICFRGIALTKITNKSVVIEDITLSWGKVTFSGKVKTPINDNIGLYIRENNKYVPVETAPLTDTDRISFTGDMISRERRFSVTVKKKNADMVFYLGSEGNYTVVKPE